MSKTTMVVRGRVIEYGVSDKGIFGATWLGERYEHATLAGLKAALDRQLKQKPMLSVAIVKIEQDHFSEKFKLVKGTVVGIHSGNRNLLVKWDDAREVEQHRDRGHTLRGNTDLNKLRALYTKALTAQKRYEEFRDANAFERACLKQEGEES